MPPRRAHLPAAPGAGLPAALAGATALLIDLDGILVQAGRPIAGAGAALAALDRAGVPYLVATNTSLLGRAALAARVAPLGIHLEAARIVSALSVTADLTARRYPGRPLFVLTADEARPEFAGQSLLPLADRAAEEPASCAAVVIGDAAEALTYANLDRAFRLVRGGARLIAMHRNPWWLTARGPTLDSGAFVAGLEFATGRRALVAGKPSATFFAAALRQLGRPAAEVVMVGDDLRADIAGSHRAGLRAVWIPSGRDGPADLARRTARGAAPPDAVAPDLAAVVAALTER